MLLLHHHPTKDLTHGHRHLAVGNPFAGRINQGRNQVPTAFFEFITGLFQIFDEPAGKKTVKTMAMAVAKMI